MVGYDNWWLPLKLRLGLRPSSRAEDEQWLREGFELSIRSCHLIYMKSMSTKSRRCLLTLRWSAESETSDCSCQVDRAAGGQPNRNSGWTGTRVRMPRYQNNDREFQEDTRKSKFQQKVLGTLYPGLDPFHTDSILHVVSNLLFDNTSSLP